MEASTIQKYIHTSPRKLRLVADMVRKLTPDASLNILRLTPKAAASDLIKAIETVMANAKLKGLDASKLTFKKLEINESMKMRRFRAGTRGRAKPYKKRMANIRIVISDELAPIKSGLVVGSKEKENKENKIEKKKEDK